MKKQNIWLWALTAAVVLLAAALAETQGQLGELQTAYSALQQEVGELRLDLKSTQNRLQEQEEALADDVYSRIQNVAGGVAAGAL